MAEIGRTPATISRFCIHHGETAVGSTPSMSRAVYRVAPESFSIATGQGAPSDTEMSGTEVPGSTNGTVKLLASSRPSPRIENA